MNTAESTVSTADLDLFEQDGACASLAPGGSSITYTPGCWTALLEVTRYAKAKGWIVPNDPSKGVEPETEKLPNGDVRITLAPRDHSDVELYELPGAYVLLTDEDRGASSITFTPGEYRAVSEVANYAKAKGWIVPNAPELGLVEDWYELPNGDYRVRLMRAEALLAA